MNTTHSATINDHTNGADCGAWVGKTWMIHYAEPPIETVLRSGCNFRLVAADKLSPTGSYKLEFDGDSMPAYWNGLILQALPGRKPRMENLTPWDDNDDIARASYDQYLIQFREQYLRDSGVERLQGIIEVDKQVEIVCFYNCACAQSNGEDWIVVDIYVPTRQNGTAHGDPWAR